LEVRYAAAVALGGIEAQATVDALEEFVSGNPGGLAAVAAESSLVSLGDTDHVEELVRFLPMLRGSDLLLAGRALLRVGDPRGTEAVLATMRSDDELLRLEAAATLGAETGAHALVDAALASSSSAVRARAVEAFASQKRHPTVRLVSLLTDDDPWVRLAASNAVLTAGR
jgi:HEAT repeat protein